ncbi:MAG: hypothetical protein H6711_17995 [Myxococcales bacterium]|nr:hypothetical protein [Myxococcales bacterium]
MRLWWQDGACAIEIPTDDGGVRVIIDADGEPRRQELAQPPHRRELEPFAGLADAAAIEAADARSELIDAVRLPDGPIAALAAEGGKAILVVGDALAGPWSASVELTTKGATSVTWPKGLVWSGKAPRSRARKMVPVRGALRLSAGADALAVTCLHTGVVALFRGLAGAPALLRLPIEDDVRLYATPTATGVLITLIKDEGPAALVHCADDGTILGQRAAFGAAPALVAAGRAVLVEHDAAEGDQVHLLRLPDLAAASPSAALPLRARLAALGDDGHLALSDGAALIRGVLDEEGLTLAPPVDLLSLKTDRMEEDEDESAAVAADEGEAPADEGEGASDEVAAPAVEGEGAADEVENESLVDASEPPADEGERVTEVEAAADEVASQEAQVEDTEQRLDEPAELSAATPEPEVEDAGAPPEPSHGGAADTTPAVEPDVTADSHDAPEAAAVVVAETRATADDVEPAPKTAEAADEAPTPAASPTHTEGAIVEPEVTAEAEVATDASAEPTPTPLTVATTPAAKPPAQQLPLPKHTPPPPPGPPATPTDAPRAGELSELPLRSSAAPAIAVALGGPPTPGWQARVGAPYELTLRLRSVGRASRGLRVAIGGEAIARGLVQLLEVEGNGQVVEFALGESGMRTAVLPALALPAGVLVPFEPPPITASEERAAAEALAASHIEVIVRCRGIRPGSGFLTLAVAALGSAAAPLRWLRPISVRA